MLDSILHGTCSYVEQCRALDSNVDTFAYGCFYTLSSVVSTTWFIGRLVVSHSMNYLRARFVYIVCCV
jgi:hypothetical protein